MNRFDPHKHHRRSIRLQAWDYTSAGAYFVTICAYKGLLIFGEITNNEKHHLSLLGHLVDLCWQAIPAHFPMVTLDAHIVMPNHFHGILWIDNSNLDTDTVGATHVVGATHGSPLHDPVPQQPHGPQKQSLGAIIGQFKSSVTRRFNQIVLPENALGHPVWQRNFYDKVVRSDEQLRTYQTYIANNPCQWFSDKLHPEASENQFNQLWARGASGPMGEK